MNAVAIELQAYDTHVVNPSGLDAPGQVTSAYDLALIARAALDRDDFRRYATTPTADLPASDGTTYQIQNGNRLLGAYDGLIAGKTGYTTLARHTYVGAAERGERSFVVTVMRTEGRAEDVAAALLDWAFANADAVEPVGALVDGEPVPVVSASTPAATTPPATIGAPEVVAEDAPRHRRTALGSGQPPPSAWSASGWSARSPRCGSGRCGGCGRGLRVRGAPMPSPCRRAKQVDHTSGSSGPRPVRKPPQHASNRPGRDR